MGRARIVVGPDGILIEGRRSTTLRAAVYVVACMLGAIFWLLGSLGVPAIFSALALVVAADRSGQEAGALLFLAGALLGIVAAASGPLAWHSFRWVMLPRLTERVAWREIASISVRNDGLWVVVETRYGPVAGHLIREAPANLRALADLVHAARPGVPDQEPRDRIRPIWFDRTVRGISLAIVVLALLGAEVSGVRGRLGASAGFPSAAATPAPGDGGLVSALGADDESLFARCAKDLIAGGKYASVQKQLWSKFPAVDVDDIVQASLITACEKCSVPTRPCPNVEGYFFIIAQNAALSAVRRGARDVACDLEQVPADETCTTGSDTDPRVLAIRRELTCLDPPARRLIFEARYVDGLGFAVIAEKFAISEKQAKDSCKNTMRILKARVERGCPSE